MKGLTYTLEAMIAAFLILSALVTVYAYSSPKESFDAATIRDKGFFCIKYMDSIGLLRNYALQNNTAGIRSYVRDCLPRTLNFSVSFCPACAPDVPGNRTIVSVNYILAGEDARLQPTSANLFLWSIV